MDANQVGYEVDFLPVGDGEKSGDAITMRFGSLFRNPREQTVVVIDGGFKSNGEELVKHIKEFYQTGRVDCVVCTHPDADHVSGLSVVLEQLEVGCLLMHQPWNHTNDISHLFEDSRVTAAGVRQALIESLDQARDLEKLATRKGIRIVEPFSGLNGFNGALRVIGPTEAYYKSLLPGYRGTPEPEQKLAALARFAAEAKEVVKKVAETFGIETLDDFGETTAENNSSAVLLLTVDGQSMLFTADAGIPALTEAISRLQQEGFDFATLKSIQVPHHGSRRNIGPTLLNTLVGPKLQGQEKKKTAFVSVSPEGAPKHPAKKVMNAFLRRGAPVHATSGKTVCHSHNAPARAGWVPSNAFPLFDEVEE